MEEVVPKQAADRREIGNGDQNVNAAEDPATEDRATVNGDGETVSVARDRMNVIPMVAVSVVEGTEDRGALAVLLSSGCSTKITTVNSAKMN